MGWLDWLRRPLTPTEIAKQRIRKVNRVLELSEDGLLKPDQFEAHMTAINAWTERQHARIKAAPRS
jgi:hypothetical protein